jgi:hypothetical protein
MDNFSPHESKLEAPWPHVERAFACYAGDLPIANGLTAPCGRARGREGILIWCADRLQAVKWRNCKVHCYRQDTMVSPPIKLGIPLLFNLYTNPREDEDKVITDSWIFGVEDGRRIRSEREETSADRDGNAARRRE